MKILHITSDEKFIDSIHYLFEKAFPGQNLFNVILPARVSKTKYIKNLNDTKLFNFSNTTINKIVANTIDADLIIFHCFTDVHLKIMDGIENIEKIMYIVWGAEIYQNPLIFRENIIGPLTQEVKLNLTTKLDIFEKLKSIYRFLRNKGLRKKSESPELKKLLIKEALKKIRIIGLLSFEELEMFKRLEIVNETIIQQKVSYYPLEFIIKGLDQNIAIGNNILIGNSSSYTNNHLEIFEILSKFDIGNRKVIVPLSYGPRDLAKYLKKKGKETFGKNFVTPKRFLPLEEYNQILQTAGIVIMNHYRQQAVGNILSSLYMGAKIYLSENNVLYSYFKNLGCYIYTIESDLITANVSAFNNLTINEFNHNRKIIENEISEKSLIQNLKSGLIKYVSKESKVSLNEV